MALAVPEFQLLLVQLANDLGVKGDALVRSLDRLDKAEALAFITDAYPELARAYLAAAGELTVQWYDEQPTVTRFAARPSELLSDDRLAASGRWALAQSDPVKALQGTAQRAVMDQSRITVLENLAAEYDVPMTELRQPGTRWARHASANACSFCRMLATRGAVYRSEASASGVVGRSASLTVGDRRRIQAGHTTYDEALERRSTYQTQHRAAKQGKNRGDSRIGKLRGNQSSGSRYHDHCACTAVPVRPGGSYEPAPYTARWDEDYAKAWKEARAAGEITEASQRDGLGELGSPDFRAVLRRMNHMAK